MVKTRRAEYWTLDQSVRDRKTPPDMAGVDAVEVINDDVDVNVDVNIDFNVFFYLSQATFCLPSRWFVFS